VVATHRATITTHSREVMCVCVCLLDGGRGALLVEIVYSVKVPSVVRGMWCAVCGQECWFYNVSGTRNGTKLKKVYVFLFHVTAHQQHITIR
jgi:hypothetical protein